MYSYIYVPSLLCAELVWAELVIYRVGYVPSLLCAELTSHQLKAFTDNRNAMVPVGF